MTLIRLKMVQLVGLYFLHVIHYNLTYKSSDVNHMQINDISFDVSTRLKKNNLKYILTLNTSASKSEY